MKVETQQSHMKKGVPSVHEGGDEAPASSRRFYLMSIPSNQTKNEVGEGWYEMKARCLFVNEATHRLLLFTSKVLGKSMRAKPCVKAAATIGAYTLCISLLSFTTALSGPGSVAMAAYTP